MEFFPSPDDRLPDARGLVAISHKGRVFFSGGVISGIMGDLLRAHTPPPPSDASPPYCEAADPFPSFTSIRTGRCSYACRSPLRDSGRNAFPFPPCREGNSPHYSSLPGLIPSFSRCFRQAFLGSDIGAPPTNVRDLSATSALGTEQRRFFTRFSVDSFVDFGF